MGIGSTSYRGSKFCNIGISVITEGRIQGAWSLRGVYRARKENVQGIGKLTKSRKVSWNLGYCSRAERQKTCHRLRSVKDNVEDHIRRSELLDILIRRKTFKVVCNRNNWKGAFTEGNARVSSRLNNLTVG